MANYTPLQVFLQLEPDNPVQTILKDGRIKQVDAQLKTYMSQAVEAMGQMHTAVGELAGKESPATNTPISFAEGDFDLLSTPLIAQVEHLITGQLQEAHTSRLKFYADSSLELTVVSLFLKICSDYNFLPCTL